MTKDKQIKENFLFFLKSFSVSAFLVLAMEAAELILRLNYQLSYAPAIETLKLAGLFLLVLFLFSALFSVILVLISKGFGAESLKGVVETLCASAIILTWAPALYLMIVTRDFPRTMKAVWLDHHGLIPILIVVAVTALRLIFKKRFAGEFNGLVRLLWKPVAVVVVIAFVWIALSALFSAPYDTKLTRLAAISGKNKTPNIIFITFDALSAHDMSLYGYHIKTTPAWEALAKESYVFDRAHSSSNKTAPSIASIFTSKYPWTHGVYTEGIDRVKEAVKEENLPALLRDHYTSAIVSTNQVFPPFIGLGGEFDHVMWTDHSGSSLVSSVSAVIKAILKKDPSTSMMPLVRHPLFINALDRDILDEHAQTFGKVERFLEGFSHRPLFLWTHIIPPHLPYLPPRPFLGRFVPFTNAVERSFETIPVGPYDASMQPIVDRLRLRYDETVLFTDYKLSLFIGYLKETGLYDSSIIIITSDHGEMFEKGWNSHHSPYLAEPEVHVPLLIHLPGQREGGRIMARAEGVDLAPTILDLLGKAIPEWMEGETLTPYMRGEKIETKKTKFSFVHYDRYTLKYLGDDVLEAVAAYRGDYKLLYGLKDGGVSLYNITEDRGELNNRAKEYPDIVRGLTLDIKRAIEKSSASR